MWVGLAQLEVAWIAGSTALGPALVGRADGWASQAFGALCFASTFVAGGLARRAEEPAEGRSTALGVAALRLRMLAFLGGPVVAVLGVTRMPVVGADGTLNAGWLTLAFVVCALGVAYRRLGAGALHRGAQAGHGRGPRLAHAVAEAEGATAPARAAPAVRGSCFANAAALPWARTMVVSDALVALLDEEELRAVLAHEAGHLSEPKRAALLRLGAASIFVFALTAGVQVGTALGMNPSMATAVAVALVVPGFVLMRRFARKMEVRADARACATVGARALASALRKLHRALLLPMTTGARRVHPDLYNRLSACGQDVGERPAPPPRSIGTLTGLVVALSVVAAPLAATASTTIAPAQVAEVGDAAARWRLRVESLGSHGDGGRRLGGSQSAGVTSGRCDGPRAPASSARPTPWRSSSWRKCAPPAANATRRGPRSTERSAPGWPRPSRTRSRPPSPSAATACRLR